MTRSLITEHNLIFESRGFGRLLILLPGFGFDYRIFSCLDLPFDYLYPSGLVSPSTISNYIHSCLVDYFAGKAGRIWIMGWSMGSNIALEIYLRMPLIFSKLILISPRRCYKSEEIDKQLELLERSPRDMLEAFYRRCFLGQKLGRDWFNMHIAPVYLNTMDKERLMDQLRYLASVEMDLSEISVEKLLVVSGKRDIIAHMDLLPILPRGTSYMVIPTAAHLPFLFEEFTERCLMSYC